MARWIRGFLPLGILAAPGDDRWTQAGFLTFESDHKWMAICVTHQPYDVVGELASVKDKRRKCLPTHVVRHVSLFECKDCHKALAYLDEVIDPPCLSGRHSPPADFAGDRTWRAERYERNI